MTIRPLPRVHSSVPEAPPSFFTNDSLQEITYNISLLTTNPIANSIFYFFPSLSKLTTSDRQLNKRDDSLNEFVDHETRLYWRREVKQLLKCAGWDTRSENDGKVDIYLSLNNTIDSCGGRWSLGVPLINIPMSRSALAQRPDEDLAKGKNFASPAIQGRWHLSHDELQFFVARAIAYVQHNHSFCRTLVKAALLAVGVFPILCSIGLLAKIGMGAAALGVHIYNERSFQGELDIWALQILEARYGDQKKAFNVALGALRKLQDRNFAALRENPARRWFICDRNWLGFERGDHILRVNEPPLSRRIHRIERLQRKINAYESSQLTA